MPRKLEIKEGPSYKSFIHKSTIFDDGGWTLTFTFDGEITDKVIDEEKKHEASITIKIIGQDSKEPDTYLFIGKRDGRDRYRGTTWIGRTNYFYVGHYNTRTRKGECEEYTDEEFFAFSIMRKWFKRE